MRRTLTNNLKIPYPKFAGNSDTKSIAFEQKPKSRTSVSFPGLRSSILNANNSEIRKDPLTT